MKRHTHYRLALLIGLFSLHTLSACVHTRQELGMGKKEWLPNASKKVKYIVGGTTGGIFTVAIMTGTIYSIISHLTHPTDAQNIKASDGNILTSRSIQTNWTTISKRNTSIILSSIIPTKQGEFILNATQVDPGGLTVNGQPFELTTNAAPADGVAVTNSMVLEEQVWKDIIDSGFQIENIKNWLAKGLNIDAKDERGSTILTYAIIYKNAPAIQFIINKGANVNAQDKYGNTPLMLAVGVGLEDIVDLFIQDNRVKICIKNKYNQIARDFTENISDFDKQTRIYNKLTEAMKKKGCTSYVNQS